MNIDNIDSRSEIDVRIKIRRENLRAFEKVLRKIFPYPPHKDASITTGKMIWKSNETVFLFRFKLDVLLLAYFLREVEPLLDEKLESERFPNGSINDDGWVVMLGATELEYSFQIKLFLDRIIKQTEEALGQQIFG